MNLEQTIYILVLVLWTLTAIQGSRALWDGVRFYQYLKKTVATATDLRRLDGTFRYQPPVVVIMPCCGVDEKLELTVAALARMNYQDYQVIFTFESENDAAYATVGTWTQSWSSPPPRVVAGRADHRGQKIHNLLAALKEVANDREVIVFLDSDSVPHADWIGHLVAPLQEPTVGVATGYRWYVATGGLAAGVRCAWNAATASLLHDDEVNFTWGGSTAIRRDRFEQLEIARHWDRALSDDYQVTRTVRAAGLKIRFVPQAIVSSFDQTTLAGFIEFARRQVIITRICAPEIWRSALLLCANFMIGGCAVAVLTCVAALGWFGSRMAMWLALAGWIIVAILAAGKAAIRQWALRLVLKPPDLTWRDFVWDVLGTVTFAGSLHLHLMLSSVRTRRFFWRKTEYEMISPDETVVLGRQEDSVAGSTKVE